MKTPTPWTISEHEQIAGFFNIWAANGELVGRAEFKQVARDILRAVNRFEELLAAAKGVLDHPNSPGHWKTLSAIIAKAEGTP